jgi:hypothetical protein
MWSKKKTLCCVSACKLSVCCFLTDINGQKKVRKSNRML